MTQLLRPVLGILVIVSSIFGMVSWMSAINPREATFDWTVRIATAIVFPASLFGLIVLLMQPESVPDFLGRVKARRIGRGGIVFAFECIARDEWASVEIHYQNRFPKPANVAVAVQPSQGFTMQRNKIDPILVQFACGPAAYGIVHVPIALAREYQGRARLFDVAESTEYPEDMGTALRNVVGPEMSKIDVPALKTAVVALKRLAATGYLVGLKMQSRVKVALPVEVSDSSENLPPISHEEVWTLPQQNHEQQESG
jgi:hypothetical protein